MFQVDASEWHFVLKSTCKTDWVSESREPNNGQGTNTDFLRNANEN